MHKFVRSLITEWRRLGLPFGGETIVVAVSGGADSLSLLLALDDLRTRKKLELRIVAAHFNHKLRGHESDADEEFVRQLAIDKDIELAIGHGPIAEKGNVEQNARNARYAFLFQTAKNLNARGVATAHTMNDQAETFLLNLIRGSGRDGLSGMPPVREWRSEGGEEVRSEGGEEAGSASASPYLPFSPTPPLLHSSPPLLLRPLLAWAVRRDTENFCHECGVEFRYDTMNEDMSFKRVRVRKILLPVLLDLNPKIIETLARTADLMRESPPSDTNGTSMPMSDRSGSEPPASAAGRERGVKTTQPSDGLLIRDLKKLDKPALYDALRNWLRIHRGGLRSITQKHLAAIDHLISSPKSGRMVELPGKASVRRNGGRLLFSGADNIKVDK